MVPATPVPSPAMYTTTTDVSHNISKKSLYNEAERLAGLERIENRNSIPSKTNRIQKSHYFSNQKLVHLFPKYNWFLTETGNLNRQKRRKIKIMQGSMRYGGS